MKWWVYPGSLYFQAGFHKYYETFVLTLCDLSTRNKWLNNLITGYLLIRFILALDIFCRYRKLICVFYVVEKCWWLLEWRCIGINNNVLSAGPCRWKYKHTAVLICKNINRVTVLLLERDQVKSAQSWCSALPPRLHQVPDWYGVSFKDSFKSIACVCAELGTTFFFLGRFRNTPTPVRLFFNNW